MGNLRRYVSGRIKKYGYRRHTYYYLLNSTLFGLLFLQLFTWFCTWLSLPPLHKDENVTGCWPMYPTSGCSDLGRALNSDWPTTVLFEYVAGTLEKIHPFLLESQITRRRTYTWERWLPSIQLCGRRMKMRPRYTGSRTRAGERKASDCHLNHWTLLCPTCKYLLYSVHSWTSS